MLLNACCGIKSSNDHESLDIQVQETAQVEFEHRAVHQGKEVRGQPPWPFGRATSPDDAQGSGLRGRRPRCVRACHEASGPGRGFCMDWWTRLGVPRRLLPIDAQEPLVPDNVGVPPTAQHRGCRQPYLGVGWYPVIGD